jgi:serine/threonine protein kinase
MARMHCRRCFELVPDLDECRRTTCVDDRQRHDLPLGTILNGQFEIGNVLGRGSFGIVYLAWSHAIGRPLALKELFPPDIVNRAADGVSVSPHSTGSRLAFDEILSTFFRQGMWLANLPHHPAITGASTVFEACGTAYLAMETLAGRTLEDYLRAQPKSRIPYSDAYSLFAPVIDALALIHRASWVHLDVSPDNMMLTRDGQVKLFDFGAARAFGRGEAHGPVFLKNHYSPLEQYENRGAVGPWTDVYALSASIYRAITGILPTHPRDRSVGEPVMLPSSLGIPIEGHVESALLRGLALDARARIQTLTELWPLLVPFGSKR